MQKLTLSHPIKAAANSQIEITVWIAKDMTWNTAVKTFKGKAGEDYQFIESNTHKDLFTVEQAEESGNGTDVGKGQIPAIVYKLV